MKLPLPSSARPIRLLALMLVSALLASGCSESSDPVASDTQSSGDVIADGGNDTTEADSQLPGSTEQTENSSSRPQPVQLSLELIPDKTFRISWDLSDGADFYRVLENPDGITGYVVVSEDLTSSIQSYDHRVALFNRVNARYIVQACNQSGCADSAEQSVPESLEQAIGYFKASNSQEETGFGAHVSQSADGNTLAVKAEWNAVYVFERSDGRWQQQALLENADSENTDRGFGGSIDLSADGDTLAVGAMWNSIGVIDTDDYVFFSGAAYIFKRKEGVWEEQAYIQASNPGWLDEFGQTVSLSADGNTLAVGALGEDSNSTVINGDENDLGLDHGAVYVFVQEEGDWQQQAYLKSSFIGSGFGQALDLSVRGDTLVAGEGSSFHVFVRENSEWQHQKMQRDNSGNNFSNDVSLSADGNLLAVGSPPNRSDVPNNTLGAVFVYERLDGVWQQQAFLQSSNPADSNNGVVISTGDRFGQAVSLSADGSTIAVGAPSEKSSAIGINGDQNDNSLSNSGAAYVFTRVDGSWQQKAYVKSANSHRSQDFGSAINLDADGDSLAIGARGEHSNANGINGDRNGSDNPDSGAVFLY